MVNSISLNNKTRVNNSILYAFKEVLTYRLVVPLAMCNEYRAFDNFAKHKA